MLYLITDECINGEFREIFQKFFSKDPRLISAMVSREIHCLFYIEGS